MWGVKTTPKVTALKNAGDISLISGLRLSRPMGSGCNEINQQNEMNHGHQKWNQGLQKHPIPEWMYNYSTQRNLVRVHESQVWPLVSRWRGLMVP